MIDTDKYEGYTPEAWGVDEDDPYRVIDVQECTIARTDFIDIEEEKSWQLANAQLIADAPLLLEEVKRLREQLLRGVKMMNKTPNQTKEGRRNWAKRFEREVREMIE